MIYFTICSRNFYAYAITLWSSLRVHDPACRFYLVLCDEADDFEIAGFPFPIIEIGRLGISKLDEMKANYNITELNTSVKPFAFLHLFDRHPGEPIVYLDPDIMAFSRFTELEALFEEGAECVLTPHILGPSEHAYMGDLQFLKYGIYNLGFCALRDTDQVRTVVAWWARRLEDHCIIDIPNGLFVDQKWADYLPAFIENTSILRHCGYNVAYWNLPQRRLARIGSEWYVNGTDLRFFHFSGNRIEDEAIFSRHSTEYTIKNTPSLGYILEEYRRAIFSNGHEYFSSLPYAFSWSGKNGVNEHTPEELRRASPSVSTPFLPSLSAISLEQFMSEGNHNSEAARLRRSIEISQVRGNAPFFLEGFCVICGGPRPMQVSTMWSSAYTSEGYILPNWREHLNCLECSTNNITRGAITILEQKYRELLDGDIYITEAVTPLFNLLSKRYNSIVGSEYISPSAVGGSVIGGIRHEDIQNLSFSDSSFDLILSFDVLEHVPFPEKAFFECYRCLRPGGRLLFTVPFSSDHERDVIRAELDDGGGVIHRLEPEFHGNPMDMESGSLCFRYFGWQVVSNLENAGFSNVEVLSYWSWSNLHLGDRLFVITAQKQYN